LAIIDLSMVVGNLNTVGIAALPYKTDSPLPVDPKAVLAFSVAVKSLQMVRRRDTEGIKEAGRIQGPPKGTSMIYCFS